MAAMNSEDKIGSLQEEALKRKERLRSLKRKFEEEGKNESKTPGDPVPLPK